MSDAQAFHRNALSRNCSSRSRRLFQPSLWRSRDSSLGNCLCFNRSSVPPRCSKSSTVTTLVRFSQASSSSHCHVNTIFFSGTVGSAQPHERTGQHGQAGPALGVKDRLSRSSNCSSLLHTPKGQARIELTDALGLTRSRFIEDRAPAALLHQIKDPLKKIEASSIS